MAKLRTSPKFPIIHCILSELYTPSPSYAPGAADSGQFGQICKEEEYIYYRTWIQCYVIGIYDALATFEQIMERVCYTQTSFHGTGVRSY